MRAGRDAVDDNPDNDFPNDPDRPFSIRLAERRLHEQAIVRKMPGTIARM